MNQMFINTILQTVSPIITVILEVGLALLVIFAIKFIRKYLVKLGIVINDEEMSAIEDIVKKAVITINQKLVDNMKELSPDGKLTNEQQIEVYNAAYKIIKDSLTADQLGLIKKIYGDEETGVEVLIENMVAEAKENKITPLRVLPDDISYATATGTSDEDNNTTTSTTTTSTLGNSISITNDGEYYR